MKTNEPFLFLLARNYIWTKYLFDRKVKGFGISILKNGWKTTSSWELMVFKKKQRKTLKISVEVTTKYLEILQNSKVKCGNCWQIVQSSWNYVLQIFVSVCVWNNWHFVRIKITAEIWPSQHQVISHNYWTFLCWRCSRLNPSFLEISWSSLICHRIALNAFHPKTEEDISFQPRLYLLPQDKFLRFFPPLLIFTCLSSFPGLTFLTHLLG